jgi:serpin B
MRHRPNFFAQLSLLASLLAGLSFLGCSSDDTVTKDSAAPDLPPETGRADVVPPVDLIPAQPDGHDDLPPPVDVGPAPLDTATPTDVAGLDASVVDASPSVDGGTIDSNIAVDVAHSQVQRIVDPQVPTADTESLAADNAAFAFAAYQQLATSAQNLVFSPASISIALAMTYAGAQGTTAAEMAQALHFNLPPARLHPAFNALDQALASRGMGKLGTDGGPMQVRIVNSLWAQQSFPFRADFLDGLAANYGAPVYLVDFVGAPDPSRQTINAWVADMTAGRILDLLPQDSIDNATKLVLTNAVYFNALWKTPLESTFDDQFTLLDGSKRTVKRVSADSLPVPYAESATFRAISLPYADDSLSLVVVVPTSGQFTQVEASLGADTLKTIVSGMTTKRVGLRMPKFTIDTTTKLMDLLKQLGMKAAFDPATADFSGMTGGRDLFIGGAYHKAFITVGEKGTEAAAATAVVMKDASIPMVDTSLTIDRPFLYYLRDNPTGAILFMGRVLDPSVM